MHLTSEGWLEVISTTLGYMYIFDVTILITAILGDTPATAGAQRLLRRRTPGSCPEGLPFWGYNYDCGFTTVTAGVKRYWTRPDLT